MRRVYMIIGVVLIALVAAATWMADTSGPGPHGSGQSPPNVIYHDSNPNPGSGVRLK